MMVRQGDGATVVAMPIGVFHAMVQILPQYRLFERKRIWGVRKNIGKEGILES
jgi:hypothetical protein